MRIFAFTILWLVFISSGLGVGFTQFFKFKLGKFSAPVGFAILLFSAQLLYYPVQVLNLSSFYVHLLTAVLLFLASVFAITKIKYIVLEYFTWDVFWIIAYLALFFIAFYNSSLSMPRADTQMYLNYIAQNENTQNLNLFNLWTGLEGSEFVSIYLFQGYYHFIAAISFFIKQVNHVFTGLYYPESIIISAWGFGFLYAIMSGLVIVNVIDKFKTRTPFINWTIALYALFFVNFYYWKVAFAFYGNTWRSLFMAMMMFYLYEYTKSKRFVLILASSFIFGASIAASSSSLFIGFSILLGFAFYLMIQKQNDAILMSSYVGLPMVVYVLFLMYNDHPNIFLPLLMVTLLYYSHLFNQKIKEIIKTITNFISQRAILIFLIILPLIAIVFSIYDVIVDPQYPWNMFHYFNDHRGYDMVIDYLFIHSSPLDNVLNLLRWTALILLVSNKQQDQDKFFKWHIILMFVFLLNPLSTSFVSKAFASNVYYRAFEAVFNVFTEIYFLFIVFKIFDGKKTVQYVMATLLIFITLSAHYQSLILHDPQSLYGFYIREGQKIDPLYKLLPRELDIILAYREEIKDKKPRTSQFTIVSHADGLRTFEPRTHVLFTARQYWSAWDRVDQDFYQIGRMWYGWEEKPSDLPFNRTCEFLKTFNVDYVINEIWINHQFDQALNECSNVVYGNQDFRLRKVND
jgi:hypothetical protein